MEMDRTLTNLSRVLSELEVGDSINTLDERVTVQKAIYLAQVIGVNLGYQYSWYIMGPYSPDLAKDYYTLHEYPPSDRQEIAKRTLREPFASALMKIKEVIRIPEGVTLTPRQWLELLASVHYLRRFGNLDESTTQHRLAGEKTAPGTLCKPSGTIVRDSWITLEAKGGDSAQ